MTHSPRVSVYLPTHNRAELLHECIDSVLQQSFTDFELIVVDDGSSDHTPAVLAELAARDARIRVIRVPTSCGAPHARNLAIEAMRGEYATGIDDDDLVLPWRLEQLLAAADDRWAFVCTSFIFEKKVGTSKSATSRVLNSHARIITLDDILHRNIAGNQALIRVARLREVGGFDATLRSSQDYDLWTRLIARYGPARRLHGASYRMRSGFTRTSITHSIARVLGAEQYRRKHERLMSRSHLKSQLLLHYIANNERIPLREWPRVMTPSTLDLFTIHTLKKWVQR